MSDHLQPLFTKASRGAIQTWRVWTEGNMIFTEFGQVGGKLQRTVGKEARGTNEGRANARGAAEQAVSEAKSMWENRLERKYRLTPEEAEEPVLLPMLAHSYHEHKKDKVTGVSKVVLTSHAKKLAFPVFTQPKFDGVRCIARWNEEGTELELISRGGKRWLIMHIIEELQPILPADCVLDGELYIHGMSMQQIGSLAKDYRDESIDLEYHVYDMPVVNGDWDLDQLARLDSLRELLGPAPSLHKVHMTITGSAGSAERLVRAEKEFVNDGYEGLIIRGRTGKYLWGLKRSPQLLKFKAFQTAEFEVVGCEEGEGKFKGAAIFVCANDVAHPERREGFEYCEEGTFPLFRAAPKGRMTERRKMFDEQATYIGRKLTVRFFDRTDGSIPHFPVGVGFRPSEDLPC